MTPAGGRDPKRLRGLRHLPGYLSVSEQSQLLRHIRSITSRAPLYAPTMPRTGKPLSVRMTNCGPLGWVSDKAGGYRYQAVHPATGRPWPRFPATLLDLWTAVARYSAAPEACLITYYGPTSRMGSHRDADEEDLDAPVVSISLGDHAVFHVGGLRRADPRRRLVLASGDVLVLSGPARMAYHGVDRILPGSSPLLVEGGRFNLTMRRVTLATPSVRSR